jgi:peptide methionine sulfoxide reductase msrA/msrB
MFEDLRSDSSSGLVPPSRARWYWALIPAVVMAVIAVVGYQAAVGAEGSTAGGFPVGAASSRDSGSKEGHSMKPKYSSMGYDVTPLSREEVARLAAKLTPEAYRVTQKSDTEPAFCGNLVDNKQAGVYCCVVCGLPLFASDHKFHSGTGWPSFYREFDPQHVTRRTDRTHGMGRNEINCARCGAHLGHVFDDGPPPTHERHCLNSAALKFYAKDARRPPESLPVKTETAYFAGGCFWGLEHYFHEGPGVITATSGYMQGRVEHPTYEQVCTDKTGHAETVQVVFDPQRITYRRLLEAFFKMHDPTELDRQGPDVGAQYRSGIWYTTPEQQRAAQAALRELQAAPGFRGRKIVTQIEAAKTFWPAEEYHQNYISRTGRACHVTNPW